MVNIEDKIKSIGGVLKKDKKSNKCIAFGKVRIQQDALECLKDIHHLDIKSLLFYCCNFEVKDFSILKDLKIEHISILHGNFSDNELIQLSQLPTLKTVKLLDTKVSKEQIKLIENGGYSFSFLS
jgi:hypothetical protein